MELNTKFNIEDNVFFLNNNKVCEGCIERTTILIEADIVEIKYRIKVDRIFKYLLEDKVFSTKQELLDSL